MVFIRAAEFPHDMGSKKIFGYNCGNALRVGRLGIGGRQNPSAWENIPPAVVRKPSEWEDAPTAFVVLPSA